MKLQCAGRRMLSASIASLVVLAELECPLI